VDRKAGSVTVLNTVKPSSMIRKKGIYIYKDLHRKINVENVTGSGGQSQCKWKNWHF